MLVKIEGRSVNALVDTGSTVTLIRPDLVGEGKVLFPTTLPLVTVTGDKAEMLGQSKVNIEIGNQTFPHLTWVANIPEPCLLEIGRAHV